MLLHEIEPNVWVLVRPGDTVVRPLDADSNRDACSSQDPDGAVAEIWPGGGATSQLFGPGIPCVGFTETDHSLRNDLPSYLLVIDDQGAETRLCFTYRTQKVIGARPSGKS